MESDRSIIKTLPNPAKTKRDYVITHVETEFTFLGVQDQPDYGKKLEIRYIPSESIIELKSLKLYFQQFRQHIFSYEHLINIIYEDLKVVLNPKKLYVKMETNVRGGIYSVIEVCDEYQI